MTLRAELEIEVRDRDAGARIELDVVLRVNAVERRRGRRRLVELAVARMSETLRPADLRDEELRPALALDEPHQRMRERPGVHLRLLHLGIRGSVRADRERREQHAETEEEGEWTHAAGYEQSSCLSCRSAIASASAASGRRIQA